MSKKRINEYEFVRLPIKEPNKKFNVWYGVKNGKSQIMDKFNILDDDSKDNIKAMIFHDFSNWNAPSKQIHACESDFEAEYSQEFKDRVIKYHNGEDFDESWRRYE